MPSNKALWIIEHLLATRNSIFQRLPLHHSRADNSFHQSSDAQHPALLQSMNNSVMHCHQGVPEVTVQGIIAISERRSSRSKRLI